MGIYGRIAGKEEFKYQEIKWYRTLNFTLMRMMYKNSQDLSIKIKQAAHNEYSKDAIQEALNPWADVDIPTIDNTPLPEIPIKWQEEPIVNKTSCLC